MVRHPVAARKPSFHAKYFDRAAGRAGLGWVPIPNSKATTSGEALLVLLRFMRRNKEDRGRIVKQYKGVPTYTYYGVSEIIEVEKGVAPIT